MEIIFSSILMFSMMGICGAIGIFPIVCMISGIMYNKSWILIMKETMEYFFKKG